MKPKSSSPAPRNTASKAQARPSQDPGPLRGCGPQSLRAHSDARQQQRGKQRKDHNAQERLARSLPLGQSAQQRALGAHAEIREQKSRQGPQARPRRSSGSEKPRQRVKNDLGQQQEREAGYSLAQPHGLNGRGRKQQP